MVLKAEKTVHLLISMTLSDEHTNSKNPGLKKDIGTLIHGPKVLQVYSKLNLLYLILKINILHIFLILHPHIHKVIS